MFDTSDMILPEGFEMPAGDTGATTESGNRPAEPEAGFSMPGGDGDEDTTTGTETTPGTGTQENGTQGQPGTEAQPAETPKFKVRFNHEEKELGYDEAVPLIQKGMNYDKLQERYTSLQSDPRLGEYDRLVEAGRLLGYQTGDALLEHMLGTYYNNAAAEQGLTADQVRKDMELKRRETALYQKERSDAADRARNVMYERFITAYPEIKPADIGPETWARVKHGMDLTAAYAEQRNQELQAEIRSLRQNSSNIKAAPVGSVTNHGSAEAAAQDPFLMGFDSIK